MKIHHGLSQLPVFKNAVLTIGSFDGVHRGHRKIIDEICRLARKNNGESVLMTFDPHPRHVLDSQDQSFRLLTTLSEKLKELKSTGIDHVVVVPFTFEFSQMSREEYLEKILIQNFKPETLVIGYDHRFGLNRHGDIAFLRSKAEEYNYKIVEISEAKISELKISSTKIREALRQKEIIKANLLLGHSYQLTGRVIQGIKLGKTLGYPTANLSVDEKVKLLPTEGIYAVKLRIDGQWHKGMMYIGRRPTLEENNQLSIEVNIFDFNSEIYGEEILVEIKAYIRDDIKFDDLEGLKKQISDDERIVKRLFHRMDDDSTKLPFCSIVILNYNGRKHLETYLHLVKKNTKPPYEIIIADNASTDDSLEWLGENHPDIRLIRMKTNHGFAGGYNEALSQIRSKYYILLNSDVEPGKNFPNGLIETLEADPEIAACQPKILSWKERTRFEYAGAAGGFMDILCYPLCRGRILETTEEDKNQYETSKEIFWATGCAMAVRANLFHKLGGFDSWYFAHQEEIDLCWRMKRAGFKIVYNPNTVVYHLGGGTLDYMSTRKTYLNFKNSLANIYKNKPLFIAIPLILLRLILDAAAAIYFISKGQSNHVFAMIKSHFHFYLGLPELTKNKIKYNVNIKRTRCGPSREKYGTLRSSIVWNYYIRGKRTFKDIVS